MQATTPFDPFEGIEDLPEPSPAETRAALLKKAKRGFVPLRKEFVQKRRGERSGSRGSVLAEFITNRQRRALDALLLLHGLWPVVEDEPLDIRTWARLLSVSDSCTPNAASKAFAVLDEFGLVKREHEGRRTIVSPLIETGSGEPWVRAGENPDEGGPGFFVLPHDYWVSGLSDRLSLPGKAMLLVLLHDTQSPDARTFTVPLERMALYYGFSERTAERGYRELEKAGILLKRVQKIVDHRHPAGRREVHHRALASPFSTHDRMVLQGKTRRAVRNKAAKAQAAEALGGVK
ncbi:hypothetical protein SAMN04488564_103288 [Lentzea waywayandensis]|uniref:Uncharacterized protein n=1 Tax=Lentzea waywayandensis TaxID=84724 RepID=A0A1I6DX06_9PSEU|nr:hypothetical protein [Lentzea waywayandensis]SFR09993.1 hypothetical protein SAMN04488564_103288 [Lentzea waywayandensis]